MKIPANANTTYLRKIIADLRDEATGWHQAAKKAEDALAAATARSESEAAFWIDVATDHAESLIAQVRPLIDTSARAWKLAALAFVAGVVIGWIAG